MNSGVCGCTSRTHSGRLQFAFSTVSHSGSFPSARSTAYPAASARLRQMESGELPPGGRAAGPSGSGWPHRALTEDDSSSSSGMGTVGENGALRSRSRFSSRWFTSRAWRGGSLIRRHPKSSPSLTGHPFRSLPHFLRIRPAALLSQLPTRSGQAGFPADGIGGARPCAAIWRATVRPDSRSSCVPTPERMRNRSTRIASSAAMAPSI